MCVKVSECESVRVSVCVCVNMKSLMYDHGFLLFTAWLWLAKHHTTLSSNMHTDRTHQHTSIHLNILRGKCTSFNDCWKMKWKEMQRREGWKAALSPTLLSFFSFVPSLSPFHSFQCPPLAWPSLYCHPSIPALHMLFFLSLFSFRIHINLWKLYFFFAFFGVCHLPFVN